MRITNWHRTLRYPVAVDPTALVYALALATDERGWATNGGRQFSATISISAGLNAPEARLFVRRSPGAEWVQTAKMALVLGVNEFNADVNGIELYMVVAVECVLAAEITTSALISAQSS